MRHHHHVHHSLWHWVSLAWLGLFLSSLGVKRLILMMLALSVPVGALGSYLPLAGFVAGTVVFTATIALWARS